MKPTAADFAIGAYGEDVYPVYDPMPFYGGLGGFQTPAAPAGPACEPAAEQESPSE